MWVKTRLRPRALANYLGLLVVLLLLIGMFSILSNRFLTPGTLRIIANQIPDLTVIAVGMTFVLIVAGIDLSVGSVMAFSAAVLGVAMVDHQWPLPAAVAACLAVGLLCGLVNGTITVAWKIPAFIVTLGMLEMARGGAYFVTDSQTKYIGPRIESLAALGGIFQTSRLGSADPNGGVGLELAAIAAVVIGGTSLMGGRGSVINSFLGVLIITVLQTGLAQVGATEPTKRIITGAVIVVAVIADVYRHRLGTARPKKRATLDRPDSS